MSEERFKWEDFNISFKPPSVGDNANTTCPNCRSEHPSNSNRKCLSVHVVEKTWNCHRCGWKGGLAGGERGSKHSKVSYIIPKISQKAGLSEKHKDYLEGERCLEPFILKEMGVYSSGEAIAFPYYRNNQLVNVKYRTLEKKMWTETGAELIPYGLDKMEWKKPLFLVEGEIDYLTFLSYLHLVGDNGLMDVLSVPNGVNSGDVLASAIKGKLPPKIYIAFDMDKAGNQLADSMATQLGRERCWRVRFPKKDINQTMIDVGLEAIDKAIETAKPYLGDGIFQIEDVWDDILSYHKEGKIGGIKLGWPSLDEFYSVKTSYWTIVTGVPHSGKSGLVDQMVLKLIAKPHDWKFAICSPENQPVRDHFVQILEKYIGKPFFDGKNQKITVTELEKAKEFLNSKIFMVLPERDGEQRLTIQNVIQEFEKMKYQHGCRGYVIDPFNEMEHSRPKGQSSTEYIGEWISLVRRFCRINDVHTWVVAHPRKFDTKSDKVGHGEDTPVVRPSDIEESRHWWGKGDNILSVWRSQINVTDDVAVFVQKIKPRYVGRQGKAMLKYDIITGQYWDPLK